MIFSHLYATMPFSYKKFSRPIDDARDEVSTFALNMMTSAPPLKIEAMGHEHHRRRNMGDAFRDDALPRD